MDLECPVETIGGALVCATARLRSGGIGTPRLDAELLLGHLLGMSRTRLAIESLQPIAPGAVEALDQLVCRRLGGQPVAYITGRREFMGHVFQVGPGVLVPRPETELLVEQTISMIGRLWQDETIRVLDLCTGSGAIALSLALEMPPQPRMRITGSDISPDALRYARRNRASFGLDDVVELVKGDLLDWTAGPWDVILTNPPYLRPDQIDGNAEIAAEPRLALDGGTNGIELIERILDRAAKVAAPRFGMIIEIDPDHAGVVRAMAATRFPTAHVIIVPDLAGLHRFVSIERKESAP